MKGQNAESIDVGKNPYAKFLGHIELSIFSLILSVFVFFIARAALPNGIIPFGYPAFCAVVTSKGRRWTSCPVCCTVFLC